MICYCLSSSLKNFDHLTFSTGLNLHLNLFGCIDFLVDSDSVDSRVKPMEFWGDAILVYNLCQRMIQTINHFIIATFYLE